MMEPKAKILVVDDELGIRVACQRALEIEGYSVDLASSIRDGNQKVATGYYEMVLLDVMMPDGRGLDLLKPILEKDPETVCVIITGYATVELAVEAIKHGAYNFIAKPFTSDLLLMTVRQGLEKRHLSLEAKRLSILEQEARDLAHAKDEMEQMDRFKSEFMLMVAHELRSPVGGAQSLLRTLLKGLAGDLNQQQQEMLERVERRLDILLDLINDLLTLAAGKADALDFHLEKISIKPVLVEVMDRFTVEAKDKDIDLTYKAGDGNISVLATRDGIEKILVNLIGNAIKYTQSGGQVKVDLAQAGQDVFVSVADNGIGIPEKDLERLGEEFFRAGNVRKSNVAGTGLGLSIVNNYLEKFEGKITIESSEGHGSTFKIFLPCA